MSDQDAEVNAHFFLHCKVAATDLWNMCFFYNLGVCWATPKTTKDMLDSWNEIGRRHLLKTGGS